MGGAAVDVDVGAVWTVADHGDIEVRAGENFFGDVAGGAVGTVDDDVIVAAVDAHELIEVVGVGVDGFGNLGIAADVSAAGFGDLHLALECCFDGSFLVVAQLAAAGAEEFDAVVFKWIVAGRDDGAGEGLELAHEEGDGWRWHDAGADDLDADGGEAGGQRALEHLSGDAGVAADDDDAGLAAVFFEEDAAGGLSEFHCEFGGEHAACLATHAVCSK